MDLIDFAVADGDSVRAADESFRQGVERGDFDFSRRFPVGVENGQLQPVDLPELRLGKFRRHRSEEVPDSAPGAVLEETLEIGRNVFPAGLLLGTLRRVSQDPVDGGTADVFGGVLRSGTHIPSSGLGGSFP